MRSICRDNYAKYRLYSALFNLTKADPMVYIHHSTAQGVSAQSCAKVGTFGFQEMAAHQLNKAKSLFVRNRVSKLILEQILRRTQIRY